jgi:uncharacterized protein YggT (Ycf19 family)
VDLLCILLSIYLVICVVRVVMSWLDMGGSGTILDSVGQLAVMLTEPLFATVRRYMPQMGDLPIDLSPLVVFLVLGLFRSIVCGLAA